MRGIIFLGVVILAIGCNSAAPQTTNAPMATAASASAAPTWTPPPGHAGADLVATCAELIEAMKSSTAAATQANAYGVDGRAHAAENIIVQMSAPSDWPAERTAWCKSEMIRAVHDYLEASIDAEARATLGQIGRDQATAFERETLAPNGGAIIHALCPSAKAIPDSLEKLTPNYISRTDEWSADAGWSCLRFEIDAPQRFQYEVKTDLHAQRFDVIARRSSGTKSNPEIVELTLHGERTKDDRIVLGEAQMKRIPR